MTVGYIGLGRMGCGMARNLARTVKPLCIHDRHPPAMAALTDLEVTLCDSPAHMASQCELIFLCLPYAPEVRAALFGESGVAGGAGEGLTVVDMTTLNRADALDIAKEAADAGIAYWDCPVSGMPFRAENGTLTVLFGGAGEAFSTLRPYLECFGDDVIHCGPLGSGQAMKAVNNIIYDVNIAALCEVLPLTVAMGLDPEQVARLVMSGSSRSFASEYFVPRMLQRRFDTDYSLEDAYKDIVNVREMAAEARARLPVVEAMVGSYEAAIEAGLGGEPKSAMLKIFEDALGVRFAPAGTRKG